MFMSIITFKSKGDFSKLDKFFIRMLSPMKIDILNRTGREGVKALSSATPVDSGLTASSWYYEIENQNGNISIVFSNSNMAKGWFPVAIMLQYGHGTRNGGWVEGRDYINPAIQPIFDKLAEDAWREVIDV